MGSATALVLCALCSAAVSALATNSQNRTGANVHTPINSGCASVMENAIDVTSFLQTDHNISAILITGVPLQQEEKAGEPASLITEEALVTAAGSDVAASLGRRARRTQNYLSRVSFVADAYASAAASAGRLTIGLAQLLQRYKTDSAVGIAFGILLFIILLLAGVACCFDVFEDAFDGNAKATSDKPGQGLLSGQQVVDHSRAKDRSVGVTAAKPDERSQAPPPANPAMVPQYTAAAQAPGFLRCNSADSDTPQNTPSSVASLPRFEVKAQPRATPPSSSGSLVPEKPGGLRRGASSASVGSDTTRATSSAAVTSVSAQTAGSGVPTFLCQSLIMPSSEVHFNMNFHELINISKGVALDIKSSSGKSTVRCRLLDAAAGAKRVEVESIRRAKDPALIVTVVQRAPNADVLEVLSRGSAPYGSIARVSGSQAKLIINEVEGMIFQVNDLQRFELVAMRGGVQVGTALRAVKGGFSVWNITIAPGADWPMIVAAFVSMLALDFPAGSGLAAALSRGA